MVRRGHTLEEGGRVNFTALQRGGGTRKKDAAERDPGEAKKKKYLASSES